MTTITATNGITDAANNPLAAGTIAFVPTNANGQPLGNRGGGGQWILSPRAVTCGIANGQITTQVANNAPCQVADSYLTTAANVCYKTTITDTTTSTIFPAIPCLQPHGSTWDLSAYSPITPGLPIGTAPGIYGAITAGDCAYWESVVNIADAGAPCGVGTVDAGTAAQYAVYASGGNTLSGHTRASSDVTGELGYAPLNPANNLSDLASQLTALNNLLGAAGWSVSSGTLTGALGSSIALTGTGPVNVPLVSVNASPVQLVWGSIAFQNVFPGNVQIEANIQKTGCSNGQAILSGSGCATLASATVQVHITSSQIPSLHETCVTAVAAQGANTFIQPTAMVAQYVPNTTYYTNSGSSDIAVQYGNGQTITVNGTGGASLILKQCSGALCTQPVVSDLIRAALNADIVAGGTGVGSFATAINSPLQVCNPGSDWTGGDGSLWVTTTYTVVTTH
jgi:hypothetical protein